MNYSKILLHFYSPSVCTREVACHRVITARLFCIYGTVKTCPGSYFLLSSSQMLSGAKYPLSPYLCFSLPLSFFLSSSPSPTLQRSSVVCILHASYFCPRLCDDAALTKLWFSGKSNCHSLSTSLSPIRYFLCIIILPKKSGTKGEIILICDCKFDFHVTRMYHTNMTSILFVFVTIWKSFLLSINK